VMRPLTDPRPSCAPAGTPAAASASKMPHSLRLEQKIVFMRPP